MADITYDDSLLETSENLAKIDWDGIETGGKLSVANTPHLCLVKKVGAYQHNFDKYTGPRLKVVLLVIDGPDKGKTQYDDITLPHVDETQGSQNRRVLIGTRMGLMQKGSKETVKVDWKTLEGRQAAITVEDKVSESGKYKGQIFANVKFDGWQDPAAAPAATGADPAGAGTKPAQDYGDI